MMVKMITYKKLSRNQKILLGIVVVALIVLWFFLAAYNITMENKRTVAVSSWDYPLDIMGNTLQRVTGGACKTSAQSVTFKEGEVYMADTIAGIANMGYDTVQFCCYSVDDPNDYCYDYYIDDYPDSFECTTEELRVISSASGRVRACCPVGEGVCTIGFAPVR